ncbi:hypothetical protein G5714_019188 [Onychostoma macrolepis]|uniref:C2H2-type domain-containing protein n=1 Tax=Onychostoma macrolepis TaxID=369639 RepID=A0A7J6C576_9TELE|nr:hypothetical protein G5714_019188 [Onychostoma macrolepis]
MSADDKVEIIQILRDIKSKVQENSTMLKKILKDNTVPEVPSSTCVPSKNLKLPLRTFEDVARTEMELKNTTTRKKYHITIQRRGQEPQPQRYLADTNLFTCPFCTSQICKPRQYHQIVAHIAGHKIRATEYGGYVIYSCGLGCGQKAKHFHCCQCPQTYINKAAIKRHLCSFHPLPPAAPDPPRETPSLPPAAPDPP